MNNRVSGVPCPICGKFIPISMQQMIHDSAATCPSCGLRLEIDNKKAQKAEEMIKKFKELMKNGSRGKET